MTSDQVIFRTGKGSKGRTSQSSEPEAPAGLYVCASCLHGLPTFSQSCWRCGFRRVEHAAFKRQQLGDHWRELLQAESGMVS